MGYIGTGLALCIASQCTNHTGLALCIDSSFAECGKLSRGNLWKIKCGTFRKLPHTPCRFSAFRNRKMPHFRGSQNYRSLALHSRCATDAYQREVSRGPLKNEKNGLLDIALKQEHTIQNHNTPVTHNIQ